jgi:hypothetical protein
MSATRFMRRGVRSLFSLLVVPVLVAATVLGISPTGHPSATLSPSAEKVAGSLSRTGELPAGTTLRFGDKNHQYVLKYDAKGRMIATPPKGETFGRVIARGAGRLTGMLGAATTGQQAMAAEK